MKKILTLLFLPLIFLVSCTNLDDINRRLDEHETRLKSLETMVKEANTSIGNIQKLLDAQAQKISITAYNALSDGSGYVLEMSDGSKITLKNGHDGETPHIDVKEMDGVLYWTLNGELMLDGNGHKIKAEGHDGTDGMTPKLRVNSDGYWEISIDGGDIWSAVLDPNGEPVKAEGSDAHIDLEITQTEDAIIIIYKGTTYTIPLNAKDDNAVFKVTVPEIISFAKSNVLKVLDADKNQIAEICLEYIKSENVARQMRTIYPSKMNMIDHSEAISLEDGGRIQWNEEKNTCTYSLGTSTEIKEIFIDANGVISITTNSNNIIETTVEPYLLIDERGSEVNEYGLVKIGRQVWMRENLKTLHYLDGTPIVTGLKKEDWLATTEGAVAAYDGNLDNISIMGALYNWYAVNSDKGLAPEGYRVSSDQDWSAMAFYLDPENFGKDESGARESETIAPLLKSVDGWKDGGNGNNLSGLNAYPNGSTSESKYFDFSGKGRQAYFWTSNAYEGKTAMFRRLYYDENFTNRWFESMTYGYSVRCVRQN